MPGQVGDVEAHTERTVLTPPVGDPKGKPGCVWLILNFPCSATKKIYHTRRLFQLVNMLTMAVCKPTQEEVPGSSHNLKLAEEACAWAGPLARRPWEPRGCVPLALRVVARGPSVQQGCSREAGRGAPGPLTFARSPAGPWAESPGCRVWAGGQGPPLPSVCIRSRELPPRGPDSPQQ